MQRVSSSPPGVECQGKPSSPRQSSPSHRQQTCLVFLVCRVYHHHCKGLGDWTEEGRWAGGEGVERGRTEADSRDVRLQVCMGCAAARVGMCCVIHTGLVGTCAPSVPTVLSICACGCVCAVCCVLCCTLVFSLYTLQLYCTSY